MLKSPSSTVLITGATTGIGFETARRLLASGSTVVIHGPDSESTEDAIARLVESGADPLKIDSAVADFTRFGEVTEMAREVSGRYRSIDVLVNNAAMAGPPGRSLSADGNEVTFQVNYLAHFLLTGLLMERLSATGHGRVINLSSTLHRIANINWSDPQRTRNYSPLAVYAQTKLALTMFARALVTKQPAITAVSVHPGVVGTDLLGIYSSSGEPVAVGGEAVSWLCLNTLTRGAYYDQGTVAAHAGLVDNRSAVERLWKLSAGLVGLDRAFAEGKG